MRRRVLLWLAYFVMACGLLLGAFLHGRRVISLRELLGGVGLFVSLGVPIIVWDRRLRLDAVARHERRRGFEVLTHATDQP